MICPDDETLRKIKANCPILSSFPFALRKQTKFLTNANRYSIFFYIYFFSFSDVENWATRNQTEINAFQHEAWNSLLKVISLI